MRKRSPIFITLLLVLFAGFSLSLPVYAGLNEGLAAQESGDFETAIKEFEPIAEQGYLEVQLFLGIIYFTKMDDDIKAEYWLRTAAEQGHVDAQFTLGIIYTVDGGSFEDPVKAAYWFKKAATQGHADAQYDLGRLYLGGNGVSKDYMEAARWSRKAAEQGHAGGQYTLGLMYGNGRGFPRDYVLSYMWFNLAASQDHEDARRLLDSLEKDMTPQQISEAQMLSREFKAK